MKISKTNAIMTGLFIAVIWFINSELLLMAYNIQSSLLWLTIIETILIILVSLHFAEEYSDEFDVKRIIVAIVVILLYILALFFDSRAFAAGTYANVMQMPKQTESISIVPSSNDISRIAIVDTKTAEEMGTKKLSTFGDVGSQLDIGQYTTIVYKGQIEKAAPLEYSGFFKYLSLKDTGTPGYMINNPVTGQPTPVKTKSGMKYLPSAYWGHDLLRHVRHAYPNTLLGDTFFEIDEEGEPYFITATVIHMTGLGCEKVTGVIVTDAITGQTMMYNASDVPAWIDTVYNGEYICSKYDDHGMLLNGFFNSVFSKKGCTETTSTTVKSDDSDTSDAITQSDYGYISDGTDIWVYTGITSARSQNASDIGMIMVNGRTGEIKYAGVDGADEQSAMNAANGELQQYGYQACFPSLLNIDGKLAYIMVMVDKNSIIKNYAVVDTNDISRIAIGKTSDEAIAAYCDNTAVTAGTKDAGTVSGNSADGYENISGYSINAVNGKTEITVKLTTGKTVTYMLGQ